MDFTQNFTHYQALFYFVGVSLFALGISLTIVSNLGASPFDALLVGCFNTFGLTIGSWEFILGGILVAINALSLRNKPEYLAVVTAFVMGLFIDFWIYILGDVATFDLLPYKFIVFFTGLIVGAVGASVYIQANFAFAPIERSMFVIQKFTGWTITISRFVLSLSFLAIAFILGGPIGIGTLISAFMFGKIMNLVLPYIVKFRLSLTQVE